MRCTSSSKYLYPKTKTQPDSVKNQIIRKHLWHISQPNSHVHCRLHTSYLLDSVFHSLEKGWFQHCLYPRGESITRFMQLTLKKKNTSISWHHPIEALLTWVGEEDTGRLYIWNWWQHLEVSGCSFPSVLFAVCHNYLCHEPLFNPIPATTSLR